jgi:AbrB family looped-hinge helix DNA binding protein
MAVVTLSSKNQIVLPKEAREALGVKAGDKLLVSVHNGKMVVFERPVKYHKALEGLMRGVYGPDYLKKERESWD